MTTTEEIKQTVTGKDLIAWGHRPGPEFKSLLEKANSAVNNGTSFDVVQKQLEPFIVPVPDHLPLHPDGKISYHMNIDVSDDDELDNVEQVKLTMNAVMRTPTVVGGAIMPDACPAGPVGTIPVGGVVAAKNAIHPGMHSADICCSVMLTDLGDADPKAVLDAAHSVTHFGPGGRRNGQRFTTSLKLLDAFRENRCGKVPARTVTKDIEAERLDSSR